MNEVNFDSLKNIKAPKAWLEKAAAIPETSVKKRAFPVPYRITAAASLVLVSVIGLLVFLVHQGSDSVVVVPHGSYTATQLSTDGTTADGNTTETSASPSIIGDVFSTDRVYPTNAQGQLMTEAAITPTSSADAPSATAVPTQQSTYRSTEPVSADKTEAPAPSTESTKPSVPTNPPTPTAPPATQKPTSPYNPPSNNTEIYCTIYINSGAGWGGGYESPNEITIFCRLYDASGRLVGDDPLFSPRRMAEILSVGPYGSLFVMYNPVENGYYIQSGWYEYVFYNITGEVLYRDSTYFG